MLPFTMVRIATFLVRIATFHRYLPVSIPFHFLSPDRLAVRWQVGTAQLDAPAADWMLLLRVAELDVAAARIPPGPWAGPHGNHHHATCCPMPYPFGGYYGGVAAPHTP